MNDSDYSYREISAKKKVDMEQKLKYALIGLGVGILFFTISGIVTALLPNQYFTRTTPINTLDYVFLSSSSILLGAYVGVHYYKKNTIKKCDAVAATGGVGSFLAFACPVCNKLLVVLFGAAALLTYFEPYRPLLGLVSNGLLAYAVWWRVRK